MTRPQNALPTLALSVRQPWAWAIIYAGKDVENRSPGSMRAGAMKPGRICIHAATGMTQREYDWGAWRLREHGVTPPAARALVRSAIIGVVDVVALIKVSDSPWFGGKSGLQLADPRAVEPIPAAGALGYFAWAPGGRIAAPAPWMLKPEAINGDTATLPLFAPDEALAPPPPRPFGGTAKKS